MTTRTKKLTIEPGKEEQFFEELLEILAYVEGENSKEWDDFLQYLFEDGYGVSLTEDEVSYLQSYGEFNHGEYVQSLIDKECAEPLQTHIFARIWRLRKYLQEEPTQGVLMNPPSGSS